RPARLARKHARVVGLGDRARARIAVLHRVGDASEPSDLAPLRPEACAPIGQPGFLVDDDRADPALARAARAFRLRRAGEPQVLVGALAPRALARRLDELERLRVEVRAP